MTPQCTAANQLFRWATFWDGAQCSLHSPALRTDQSISFHFIPCGHYSISFPNRPLDSTCFAFATQHLTLSRLQVTSLAFQLLSQILVAQLAVICQVDTACRAKDALHIEPKGQGMTELKQMGMLSAEAWCILFGRCGRHLKEFSG